MGHLFLSSKYQACQIFICISSREDGDASWSQAQLEVGATRECFRVSIQGEDLTGPLYRRLVSISLSIPIFMSDADPLEFFVARSVLIQS